MPHWRINRCLKLMLPLQELQDHFSHHLINLSATLKFFSICNRTLRVNIWVKYSPKILIITLTITTLQTLMSPRWVLMLNKAILLQTALPESYLQTFTAALSSLTLQTPVPTCSSPRNSFKILLNTHSQHTLPGKMSEYKNHG